MTEYKYDEFATRLNDILRSKNDPSGNKLASKINHNPSTVNKWRTGETRPGLPEVIDAIARVLDLSEDDRVGLLYDAGYGWYVEAGTHRKTEDAVTIDHIRSEAERRGIDSYVVDKLFHMLTRHPSPEYEFSSTKTLTRVVFTAATIITVSLVAVLFMALFTPATLATLRGMVERPFGIEPTPTATLQFSEPVVELPPLAIDTVTPTYTPTEIATATATSTVTPTPTPIIEPPCEAEIISPRGISPVTITFRVTPENTARSSKSFQQGDLVIIQTLSADGQWYQIAELSGQVLGWASTEYFSGCIKASVQTTPTPSATVAEPTPTETAAVTVTPEVVPTSTATLPSEPPCEAEVQSPHGIWPLFISFRNVPDGTASTPIEFQSGDRVTIKAMSADKRWYEIAELTGRVLGWADLQYFPQCIQTSQ